MHGANNIKFACCSCMMMMIIIIIIIKLRYKIIKIFNLVKKCFGLNVLERDDCINKMPLLNSSLYLF